MRKIKLIKKVNRKINNQNDLIKKKKRFIWNNLVLFLFLLLGCLFIPVDIKGQKSGAESLPNVAQTILLSRDYLTSSGDKKAELGKLLGKYNGPIESVIQMLIASKDKQYLTETGIIEAEHFKMPGVSKKYKKDLLYFFVPFL